MPASVNQKLKILYLIKILSEETDEEHGLSLQEITSKLAAYGVTADRKTGRKDFSLSPCNSSLPASGIKTTC